MKGKNSLVIIENIKLFLKKVCGRQRKSEQPPQIYLLKKYTLHLR